MDKEWILVFAFFMLFNNSPEVMKIISSENFDEDYNKAIEALEDIESEKLKELVINKVKESKEKIKAINIKFTNIKEKSKGGDQNGT